MARPTYLHREQEGVNAAIKIVRAAVTLDHKPHPIGAVLPPEPRMHYIACTKEPAGGNCVSRIRAIERRPKPVGLTST